MVGFAHAGSGTLTELRHSARQWEPRGRPAGLRSGLGLALPALYFAAVSVVFEGGENMRYKFFVDPLLFVFLWSRAVALAQAWRGARP